MLIMCQDYKIILLLQGLIIEYLGEKLLFFHTGSVLLHCQDILYMDP